jgi:phosphate transport system protein
MSADQSDVTPLHSDHEETRGHFDEILDEVHRGLVTMGSLVLENTRRAGAAMVERRLDLVPVVREADESVNQMYSELEKLSFETLARQQPVAIDLRFLVSATRILYALERSGDLAVNCVNILERQGGFPEDAHLTLLITEMTAASCKVLEQAVEAMDQLDPDAGVALEAADDEVDDLVAGFYAAVGKRSDEIGLETAIALSRVGRFMERIADHAVNVGENITYIVTAHFPGDTHASLAEEYE